MSRTKSKFVGVYMRESSQRKYEGKPDVCFEVTYKDFYGKKVWHKVGWRSEGYTAAMASQIRSEIMRKVRHGEMLPNDKRQAQSPTLADVWARYEEQHLPLTKGRSAEAAKSLYSTHLIKMASRRLSQITSDEVEALKVSLLAKKRTPQTIRNIFSLLRTLFSRAADWGMYTGPSPLIGVKLPKVDNRRLRFLSEQEASMLLEELRQRSEAIYQICLLSLHTGMRMGEIFSLRGDRIDLENGIIHALDAKAGTRAVHMTDTVKAMLKKVIPADKGALLFPARGGGVKNQLGDTFKRAVDALKLNEGVEDPRLKIVPHTLRHTYASWLAKRGVPLYVIAELMGHSTLEMTRRYAKLAPDQKQEAVAMLDKAFTLDHKS